MKFTFFRGLALSVFLLLSPLAEAQSVLQSSPVAPLVPESLREATQSSPFLLPSVSVPIESPLRWGQFVLKPHVADRFVYSDGIQATPGQTANSYINSFSPGVLLDIGSHWTLDYTPSWVTYSNRVFKDSLNQTANLVGGAELGDWLVQFSQSYASTNAPRVETGRQTGEEEVGTTFNLSHRFDNHWSVELGLVQDLQYIEQSPNYYDWSMEDWLTYRVVTRLAFSVGYRLGYTDFSPGAYMTYSQPQAKVQWRATDKLTLSVQGGRAQRQVHKNGYPSQNTPTLNASVQYQPFAYTTLSLSANRAVAPAYLDNTVIEGRGWSAELQQRLLGHFTLNTGYSEQKSHYSGSHTELVPSTTTDNVLDQNGNVIGTVTHVTFTPVTIPDLRDDATRSFHVRLSTKLLARGTITLLYERERNISNVAGFSFDSHQIGCEVGYRW